jgi:hypothetical protein
VPGAEWWAASRAVLIRWREPVLLTDLPAPTHPADARMAGRSKPL